MNEVDRSDIESLKELMAAKFDTVTARLDAMSEAVSLAERDREKKDEQLNEVRFRFIPREVFEAAIAQMEKRFQEFKDSLEKRELEEKKSKRNLMVGVGSAGFVAVVNFILNLVGNGSTP